MEKEVSRIDIILIFQAYNKREISFEEFIRLAREWAEAMQKQYNRVHENGSANIPQSLP